jgi:hypothetical protein
VDVVWGHTGENFGGAGIYVVQWEGLQDTRAFAGWNDDFANSGGSASVEYATFFDSTGEQFDASIGLQSIFMWGQTGSDGSGDGIGGTGPGAHDKAWDDVQGNNDNFDLRIMSALGDIWEEATDMNLIASHACSSGSPNRLRGVIVGMR